MPWYVALPCNVAAAVALLMAALNPRDFKPWLVVLIPAATVLYGVALVRWCRMVMGAVSNNRRELQERRKREWLRCANRTDEPLPVPDTDLRAGLVEADGNEHITRLDPEDDESIRRA